MKTKSRKIICVALAVLLIFALSIVIAGCGEKEPKEPKYEPPKNCDVVLETESGWAETYRSFITICDSYDEIQEALTTNGVDSWDNDKVREYADEHAEDKSFVVCLCTFGLDLGAYHIKEVEVDNGRLTMYIRYPWSPDSIIAAPTVMCSDLFIAGVDKSFVANVTECEYVFV